MKVDTAADSFDSLNPPFAPNVWFDCGFNWYGVDIAGNIGVFQAAELPIPSEIFTNETEYRKLLSFFINLRETTTAELSKGKIGEIKTITGNLPDYSDCLTEAEKGLYCIKEFNTSVEIKNKFWGVERESIYGYYLVAIPQKKLNILHLPEEFQLFLKSYRLPINFSKIEKIDVAKYLICD